MAYGQLLVPERVEQAVGDLLGARLIALVEDDEIDVRIRRELSPRPATGRYECQRRGDSRTCLDEAFGQRTVINVGNCPTCRTSTPSCLETCRERSKHPI